MRSDSATWEITDWETANKLLSYLEPERRPFAVFTLPDGSYVQCLGSKRRLTVEARLNSSDETFTHWVFGKRPPIGSTEVIEVSTGTVTVDVAQILSMRDARLIIRPFLETRTFPGDYHRHDITPRFTSDHNK